MKIFSLVISVLVFQMGAICFAGPSTSGGGFAVVCRNVDRTIKSAELLDLYEARTERGLILMSPSGDEVTDYIRAVKNGYRLQGYNSPISEDEMAENVTKFNELVRWVPSNEKLPNLDDLGHTITPMGGCLLEPLAIFYDSQEIVDIDLEIWSSLDSMSRAALVTHEIFYHYYRQLNIAADTTSEDARSTNGLYFSLGVTMVKSGIPVNSENKTTSPCRPPHWIGHSPCTENSVTSYYVLPLELSDFSGVRIQFTQIADRQILAKTYLDIPHSAHLGSIYPIQSQQLTNWTATVDNDDARPGGFIKIVIRRGLDIMAELHM